MTLPRFDHFIDGGPIAPRGGAYLDVENPATGEVIAKVASGSADDVDVAVAAAKAAFARAEWRDMSPLDRSKLLCRLIEIVKVNAHELVAAEATSSGGTVTRIASLDLLSAIDLMTTMAEIVKSYPFTRNMPMRPLPEPMHIQVLKEPLGVCALITAWNVPLLLFFGKVIPALAAGNTVVVKPSELTPNTTTRLAQLFSAVLPKGVLNVVNGTGAGVGDALTSHPNVAKISFTGSTAVGKRIQAGAAASLKRVTLELGGKGAAIVTPDAPLDLVAHGVLFGVMLNAGQACTSGTRLIVHEDIYEQLLARLATIAGGLKLGNPLDPATAVGPVCHAEHGQRVLDHIRSAVEQGARVLCGGGRASVAGCEGGFFVQPTVLADCTNDMTAVREEIFGPVLAVLKYRRLDEAIAIANDTSYGLTAGVWTGDVVAAQAIARRLEAGSVWINDWHVLRSDVPFGGYKESGIGREMGVEGLEGYLQTKAVATAFQREPSRKTMTHSVLHRHYA